MKDSGVEWIGEIPEGWEVKRLKNSTRIFRGKFTHRPRNDERLYDGSYPFFQTGDVARAGKYLYEYKQTLNDFGLRVSTLFPKGTIVITIAANIGDISILDIDACFPDSIVGFEPMTFVSRDFLYNSLLVMKEQFMSSTIKNTQMNLNVDRIGTNLITIPPLKEQEEIIKHIEIASTKIATAISLKEQEIEKLKEYKATLINSAVTGKIKVC
jgi:type I restriction enzyme S subunit